MRVASWNIAGGCKVQSNKTFDYKKEDVDYFAQELAQIDADIICLQESHTNDRRSLAKIIAATLGGYRAFDSPLSPSHINSDYQLALAILARKAFETTELYTYPEPPFELHFPDGRVAQKHRKGMQVVRYEGAAVANTHWLSMLTFGYSYASGEGARYASEVTSVMLAHLTRPSIICGDFNTGEFEYERALLPLMERLRLRSALPDESTFYLPGRINPAQPNAPDRLYASSPEFIVRGGQIVKTETDHYLCWADIEHATKPVAQS